jgi:hypothetical protein
VPSVRFSIEEQSIEYCGWACCVQWRGAHAHLYTTRQSTIFYHGAGAHHVTGHNTPIHNILSTAPQLSISQKALGTLPEDGNVMPKPVGDTIHN